MGNRCTIQFKTGDETSISFYAHWDGLDLVNEAKEFATRLTEEMPALRMQEGSVPLTRYEPGIVLLNFIASKFTMWNGWISRSYNLSAGYQEQFDAGHHIIELFPDTDTFLIESKEFIQ